jgi:hypothetical protein
MPGYYETYLHGLNQAIPMARLAEQERQNAFRQNYQVRDLQSREAMRDYNQRRLEAAMEETARHHRTTEDRNTQALKLMMMRLQQQLGQGSFELKEDAEGNQWAYDKRTNTMKPVGVGGQQGAGAAGPATTFNAPKALPGAERENLSKIKDDYQSLIALAKSFKPEYTNALGPQMGRLENIAKQYVPGTDSAMPDWWRMQEELQNVPRRHAAIGGSVTRTEVPLWERSTINPGMKPDDIIKMLNVRAALLNRGLQRRLKSASTRYNRREVEAAGGMPVPKEIPQDLPSLEGLAMEGSRSTGQGRPPLEDLLR